MSSQRLLLRAAFVCALGASALAQAAEPLETYTALYARYLSEGRSDAQIHLSTDGPGPATRTTAQPDASVACHIAGLPVPGPGLASRIARRMLAALLVHEVTHCFTSPYLGPLLGQASDEASRSADLLVGLTAESISDAAAVIAVFRQDGEDAAAALVTALRPSRLWVPHRTHETIPALNAALSFVRDKPQAVSTPQAAFEAALEIGALAARRAVREAPAPTLAALRAALDQARAAYANGRFANAAFTWRARDQASSPGDTHVFLADGQARREPALGAEGAHAAQRLR